MRQFVVILLFAAALSLTVATAHAGVPVIPMPPVPLDYGYYPRPVVMDRYYLPYYRYRLYLNPQYRYSSFRPAPPAPGEPGQACCDPPVFIR